MWLLPALLSLLGDKALAIRMPWARKNKTWHPEGGKWAHYGRILQRRPWLYTLAAAALVKQGNTLADAGEVDAALASYQDAIAARSTYAAAYLQMGALLAAQERFAEALRVYEDGVAALPDNADLRLRLGQAYRREGQNEEATEQIEQAIALAPDAWQAHFALGALYEDAGLQVRALDQFSTTVSLAPDNLDALFRLAQASEDTAFLSVWRGWHVVCLHREEGPFPIRSHVLQAGEELGLGAAEAVGDLAVGLVTDREAALQGVDDAPVERVEGRGGAAGVHGARAAAGAW